jgi:hypothetical protein
MKTINLKVLACSFEITENKKYNTSTKTLILSQISVKEEHDRHQHSTHVTNSQGAASTMGKLGTPVGAVVVEK